MRVKPYGDKVPVPERAPDGTAGAGRLYADVRGLLPVPLKPPDPLRRSVGNLVHGPVSLSGKRNGFPETTRYRHRRRMTNPGATVASGAASGSTPIYHRIAG